MISINMFIQIVFVVLQYNKKPWTVKAREILICLSFLRPAMDIYRVATNYDEPEIAADPLAAMVLCKCIELASESIPSCIVQIYVYLTMEDRPTGALVSIIVSALTTGFASAMIAFDYDVDFAHRKLQPRMYGYIPGERERIKRGGASRRKKKKKNLIFCFFFRN